MTVSATSPDGKIECEISDGRTVVMEFAPGSYRRYAEPELERQLASLARAMFVGQRRAQLTVLAERLGYPVMGDESTGDGRSREFVEARGRVRAQGRSGSGRIVVTTAGMTAWEIRIRPGTVRTVDEEAFLNDLWTAFRANVADYQGKVGRLKAEIFDISGRVGAR